MIRYALILLFVCGFALGDYKADILASLRGNDFPQRIKQEKERFEVFLDTLISLGDEVKPEHFSAISATKWPDLRALITNRPDLAEYFIAHSEDLTLVHAVTVLMGLKFFANVPSPAARARVMALMKSYPVPEGSYRYWDGHGTQEAAVARYFLYQDGDFVKMVRNTFGYELREFPEPADWIHIAMVEFLKHNVRLLDLKNLRSQYAHYYDQYDRRDNFTDKLMIRLLAFEGEEASTRILVETLAHFELHWQILENFQKDKGRHIFQYARMLVEYELKTQKIEVHALLELIKGLHLSEPQTSFLIIQALSNEHYYAKFMDHEPHHSAFQNLTPAQNALLTEFRRDFHRVAIRAREYHELVNRPTAVAVEDPGDVDLRRPHLPRARTTVATVPVPVRWVQPKSGRDCGIHRGRLALVVGGGAVGVYGVYRLANWAFSSKAVPSEPSKEKEEEKPVAPMPQPAPQPTVTSQDSTYAFLKDTVLLDDKRVEAMVKEHKDNALLPSLLNLKLYGNLEERISPDPKNGLSFFANGTERGSALEKAFVLYEVLRRSTQYQKLELKTGNLNTHGIAFFKTHIPVKSDGTEGSIPKTIGWVVIDGKNAYCPAIKFEGESEKFVQDFMEKDRLKTISVSEAPK